MEGGISTMTYKEKFEAAIEYIVKNITPIKMQYDATLNKIVYDLNTQMKSDCKMYLENDTIYFIKRYDKTEYTIEYSCNIDAIVDHITHEVADCYCGRGFANDDWNVYFIKHKIKTNRGYL